MDQSGPYGTGAEEIRHFPVVSGHAPTTSPLESYLQRVRRLSAVLFVFSSILVALLVNVADPHGQYRLQANVVLGVAFLSGPLVWFFPWPRYHRNLFLVAGTIATILTSLLIYWTGGATSIYFPVYVFIVVLSGAYYETGALLVITSIACLGSASYLFYSGPLTMTLVLPLLMRAPILVTTALLCNLLYRGLTRNMADAHQRARFIEALHDIDRAILAISDEDEILGIATERTKSLLDCDRVEISIDAREKSNGERGDRMYGKRDAPMAPAEGRVHVIPLVAQGERLGDLYLTCGATDRSVASEREHMGQKFAAQIAIALHSARLRRQSEETRALIQLNRLKDDFISTASHELRTPLTSIVGFGELLVAGRVPSEKTSATIEHMYRSALHLAKLVEDLLDVSRLDGGRLNLAIQRENLVALVRQVAEEMGGASQRHHVTVDVPTEPLWVDVDEKRMRQILMNLIGNAIRYSPDGGPITIHVEQREPDVLVTVEDRGIGMPRQVLERVFDRFYRAPNATPSTAATGLGLALCHGLVAAHGGRIWAESDGVGQGSRFRFTLPRRPTAARARTGEGADDDARALPHHSSAP